MRLNPKLFVERISLERIYRLFELAGKEFEKHPDRSKKYVELAEKISERNKVKIPKELKKSFCSKCRAFLKHGKNSTIRVTKKWLNVSCKECGKVEKIGLIENECKSAEKKKTSSGKKSLKVLLLNRKKCLWLKRKNLFGKWNTELLVTG